MEDVKFEHEEETVRRQTDCDVAVHRTLSTRRDILLKKRLPLMRCINRQPQNYNL